MKLDDYKGFLALGRDSDGPDLLTVPIGKHDAIVIATEERIRHEAKRQKFHIDNLVPAKVGATILTATNERAVYIMDATCYNLLVDAVDWGIEHEHWKMAHLEKQPLDHHWHIYAVTVFDPKDREAALKESDEFAKSLIEAGDSTLVVSRESPID